MYCLSTAQRTFAGLLEFASFLKLETAFLAFCRSKDQSGISLIDRLFYVQKVIVHFFFGNPYSAGYVLNRECLFLEGREDTLPDGLPSV